jgi:uncharacterized small protein (DUF1192 family)
MANAFFRSQVIGDRVVEARLLSTKRVVKEVLVRRFEELRIEFDRLRAQYIPKDTGRAASALFSEVTYSTGPARVELRGGFHTEVAEYVDFLDFGSGIHHVPDSHPPWIEYQGGGGRKRIFATVAPFTLGPGQRLAGLQEVFLPVGPHPVLHYGNRPFLFTERAMEEMRPKIRGQMSAAAKEIKRRVEGG